MDYCAEWLYLVNWQKNASKKRRSPLLKNMACRLFGARSWKWSNTHSQLFVPWGKNPMKFESIFKHLLWINCTWNIVCRIALGLNVTMWYICLPIRGWLTLNVRGPSYLDLTRSISWLLMPWLLTSPGHQQPWYWLYRICSSFSYLRNDFKYPCDINVE